MELTWQTARTDARFRRLFLYSLLFLAVALTLLTLILGYTERRTGIVIEKNWLAAFPPQDFSILIFSITYGFAAAGIVYFFRRPETAMMLVQGYAMLTALRCITLLLVPLDPPEAIIPLNDPLLQHSFYAGRPNLKDLFFSGHVATLLLFGFLCKRKMISLIFFSAGAAAGVFLAVQRVHYITDIVAAPLFAFLAVFFTRRWPALLKY